MFTDHQKALIILQDKSGISRDAAEKLLAANPQTVEMLRPQFAALDAQIKEERAEAAREAFARSPEGKTEAAKAALKAARERAELVEGAKELIRPQFGDAVDEMDADSILINAGVAKSPAQERAEELDRRAKVLNPNVPPQLEPISTTTIYDRKERP